MYTCKGISLGFVLLITEVGINNRGVFCINQRWGLKGSKVVNEQIKGSVSKKDQ